LWTIVFINNANHTITVAWPKKNIRFISPFANTLIISAGATVVTNIDCQIEIIIPLGEVHLNTDGMNNLGIHIDCTTFRTINSTLNRFGSTIYNFYLKATAIDLFSFLTASTTVRGNCYIYADTFNSPETVGYTTTSITVQGIGEVIIKSLTTSGSSMRISGSKVKVFLGNINSANSAGLVFTTQEVVLKTVITGTPRITFNVYKASGYIENFWPGNALNGTFQPQTQDEILVLQDLTIVFNPTVTYSATKGFVEMQSGTYAVRMSNLNLYNLPTSLIHINGNVVGNEFRIGGMNTIHFSGASRQIGSGAGTAGVNTLYVDGAIKTNGIGTYSQLTIVKATLPEL